MGKVCIVGIGPGSKEYLIPLAKKVIYGADVLIGAKRLISLFKAKKRAICLEGNYRDAIDYILKNRYKKKIAVLVSGDPGIFSFSSQIITRLKPQEYEIIPGISSMQLAFARIGESWQNAFILSLHGRTKRGIKDAVLNHKKVFLFLDKKNNPKEIASFLFKRGIKKREVFLFKNLSLSNEEIIRTDINALRKGRNNWEGLWVMMIKR